MVKLTFYGGVHQIGGNKFLLEDGDTRVFLDFGTPFGERGQFYEEYLNPRPAFGLLDPLTMGLLPPLQGLYREDLEQVTPDMWEDLKAASGYQDFRHQEVHGVFLSHAHLDHTGYLSFLRPDIPVYSSALTAFLAKAIQDGGRSDFESEVVYLIPRELRDSGLLEAASYKAVPAKQRPFGVFGHDRLNSEAHAFWTGTPGSRELEAELLRPADNVGGLEVRCYPVDHSVPGAAAFAIKTSAGWIGYTGDLRLHGSKKALTEAFLRELAALKPTALLCEGTRTEASGSEGVNYTEEDVEERSLQEIHRAKGLVIADFGPRNIERLQIFARIARGTGRGLVILPKDAYLLDSAHLADPQVPAVDSFPELLVYDKPRVRPDRWERVTKGKHGDKLVSPEHIRGHQDQYILCFSFYDLNDLPSIRPREGSLYLYSSHEAFSEELRLDFQRLRNWIDHFDMRVVGLPLKQLEWQVPAEGRGLHASGHASPEDLLRVAREISPVVLIPIHTTCPQFFVEGLAETRIKVNIPPGKGTSMVFG
ncbi:MAG: exonuclease [Dehalococcoidia bacterium]